MENLQFEVKGKKLVITVDLEHRGDVSKSGKTIRVASTEGNVPIEGGVTAGINIYVKNPNR